MRSDWSNISSSRLGIVRAAVDTGDGDEAVKWAEEDAEMLSASDVFLLALALGSSGESDSQIIGLTRA
jgi:hypothetical protein